MIISITCRNGTDANICRKDLYKQLTELSKFTSSITRIEAVFSKKSHHKNADDLVACHLSIHIASGKPIEIYEYQATNSKAFIKAKDRATMRLRHNATKLFSRKRHDFLEYLEEVS